MCTKRRGRRSRPAQDDSKFALWLHVVVLKNVKGPRSGTGTVVLKWCICGALSIDLPRQKQSVSPLLYFWRPSGRVETGKGM